MSRNNPLLRMTGQPESIEPDEVLEWPRAHCDVGTIKIWSSGSFLFSSALQIPKAIQADYDADWASSVPALVSNVSSLVAEKKRQELRFNLLQIAINEFERRIHRLESVQTKLVPINTFTPEPYELLKTILVSVYSVEGGFQAGWFDANIHITGDNEEEAVSNLKGLILDFFDSLSKEPPENLGPEPARQIAILKQHIQKKP